MLTVGVDTYISLEDADKFVKSKYLNTPFEESWNNLTNEEKEARLRDSTDTLNLLEPYYSGHKIMQEFSFPRVRDASIGGYTHIHSKSQYEDITHKIYDKNSYDSDGMIMAGKASITNALYGVYYGVDINETISNHIRGVKSKTVGPVRETYDVSKSKMKSIEDSIYSNRVKMILKPWLDGTRISI